MFSFRKKILKKDNVKIKLINVTREVTLQKTTLSRSLDISIYEEGGNNYLVVQDYDENNNPLSIYNFSRIYTKYVGIVFVDKNRNILKAFYDPKKESLVKRYFNSAGGLFLLENFLQISLKPEDLLSIDFEKIDGLYLTHQNGSLITTNPYKPKTLEEAVKETEPLSLPKERKEESKKLPIQKSKSQIDELNKLNLTLMELYPERKDLFVGLNLKPSFPNKASVNKKEITEYIGDESQLDAGCFDPFSTEVKEQITLLTVSDESLESRSETEPLYKEIEKKKKELDNQLKRGEISSEHYSKEKIELEKKLKPRISLKEEEFGIGFREIDL